MYLKSLSVKGFKSFANKTILDFEPGTTAIVGPNGSGKSNIVDAFLWVLGEQNPRSLRSSKMEDVIFAGSAGKKPLGVAEVSLCFDNAEHIFPIEYSDVTITRRIFRSGESEYMLNGSPCRLSDVQELLLNTGAGKDMYSVVGQGRLESILNSRPEERRFLIEEAAGLAKYKRRKEKAIRKLAATERNLTRARDILFEVRRQLKPLYDQARLAEKHRGLLDKLRGFEIEHTLHELVEVEKQWQEFEKQKKTVDVRLKDVARKVDERKKEIAAAEEKLERSRRKAESLKEHRYALATANERVHGIVSLVAEKESNVRQEVDRLERAAQAALKKRETVARFPGTIGFLRDYVAVKDEDRAAVEGFLGQDLTLLVAQDVAGALKAVKAAYDKGEPWSALLISGGASKQKRPQPLAGATPMLDLVKAKPEVKPLLERLMAEVFVVADLKAAASLMERSSSAVFVTRSGEVLSAVRVRRAASTGSAEAGPEQGEDGARLAEATGRAGAIAALAEVLASLSDHCERAAAEVNQGIGIEAIEQEGLVEDASFKRAELSELSKELGGFERASHTEDIYKAQLEPKMAQLKSRLQDDFRISRKQAEETHRSTRAQDGIQWDISSVRRDIEQLGPINPIAVAEYKEVEERREHLEGQINDLKRSQKSLDKLIHLMEEKMAQKFMDVFERTDAAFQEFFGYLFPQGKAKLLLTAPSDILTTGIEIEAQPHGKRFKKLSLLSGGESAMTAIALIFALFRINPAPFYILDEVDVALDDVNLQRFVSLLAKFRNSTQFLIVTHQRRTMEAADILYGVSMQADGVSKLISQRLKEASN